MLVVNLVLPIVAVLFGWWRHRRDQRRAQESGRVYFAELWKTREPPELVKQRRLVERDMNGDD